MTPRLGPFSLAVQGGRRGHFVPGHGHLIWHLPRWYFPSQLRFGIGIAIGIDNRVDPNGFQQYRKFVCEADADTEKYKLPEQMQNLIAIYSVYFTR